MRLVDTFSPEDRVNVTFSEFYALVREAGKAELMMNAVKCKIPHAHIYATMTGESKMPGETEKED